MPPNHLILCHPLLLPPSVFPSIRVFSNESVLCIRWPKYWSFSFSISPSNGGWSHFRLQFTCRHHTYLFHPLMLVPGIPTHCRSQGTPFQNIPTTLPLITTPLLRDNQRLNQPRAPTSREKVREKEQTCRKSVLLLGLPFWSTAGTGWRDPSKCDSKCTFSKCESTSRSTTAAPAVLGPHFASCTGSWETCIAGSLPSPQLYLVPLPHLPTLQSSFKSSNTPCSFGPQGLCTTSINLHLVNPFCRFQLQDHFLFYEPLLTPNPLCDLMSLTILCNSQLPNRYLNIIW